MSQFVSYTGVVIPVKRPIDAKVNSLLVKHDAEVCGDLKVKGDLVVEGDIISTDELQVDACVIIAGTGQTTDNCISGLEVLTSQVSQAGVFRDPFTPGGKAWVVCDDLSIFAPLEPPNPITSSDVQNNRGKLIAKVVEVGELGTSFTLPLTKGNPGDVLTLTGTGKTSKFEAPAGGGLYLPLAGGTMTGNILSDPGVVIQADVLSTQTDERCGMRTGGIDTGYLFAGNVNNLGFTNSLTTLFKPCDFKDTTPSTSIFTGSAKYSGGVGIQKELFVGGAVNVGAHSGIDYKLPATRASAVGQVLTATDLIGTTAFVTPTSPPAPGFAAAGAYCYDTSVRNIPESSDASPEWFQPTANVVLVGSVTYSAGSNGFTLVDAGTYAVEITLYITSALPIVPELEMRINALVKRSVSKRIDTSLGRGESIILTTTLVAGAGTLLQFFIRNDIFGLPGTGAFTMGDAGDFRTRLNISRIS